MANKVSYVKNEEPAFIKAFKQKTGYKEGPTIESKREALELDEDDRSDNEDEKPTVVVLREGDLTAEEAEQLKKRGAEDDSGADHNDIEEDTEQDDDGKIKFRKPVKRQNEAKSDLQTSSSKKQKANKEKKKSTAKEVKNSSLLSFDDEEDEET